MKVYDTAHIKNIVLLGHAHAGKTTLTETMIYEAGLITRRGKVTEKNTVSDYHELEQERGNSVFSTLTFTEWRGNKINIIDTPGYDDFIGEIIAPLRVADTGILLINAQYGVEVGTEHIWEYAEKFGTPLILAVNQIDREEANFELCVEQAKQRFGNKVTVVQYPLNPGLGFDSVIDVLKMTMYKFPPEGGKPEKLPIPDSERERAKQLHNELVELAAQEDEKLMELYFDKGELDEDHMVQGLRMAMIKRDIFPLFCISAERNMGSGRLMGFINNVAPSAADMPPARLTNGQTLPCDPNGPPCIFIYKTISEPHLGDLSFFKVMSGEIKSGMELVNYQSGQTERLNQLFVMEGKKREPISSLNAGDLGAVVKLKSSHTNETLHLKNTPLAVEPIPFPEPIIRTAVVAVKQGEEEKLSQALHVIHGEDPTLNVEHNSELKQLIISGQGELHLNTVKWKLEKMFKVDVQFIEPKIPYRETITKPVKSEYRHKKQSGGAGQFAEVHMLVEPWYEGMEKPHGLNVRSEEVIDLPWGGKLVFLNCIVGGAIDARFMPSILKGVMEKMENGPLTGSRVRDVRVSVFDGKMHPVDSNDMAFKIAGLMAFRQAFTQAAPRILEPIYEVEVTTPEDYMGDVITDLQGRRAIILGMEQDGHYQKIRANVPLAELYKYSSALRSITQGRAKHTRKFVEYAVVPPDIQQKLVAAFKEELQEA
ncbi:MAG: elongation factor G [Chitinophagales bacterium]|nr:MAG: elongation factor G [Chitinophagales bacterium]